MSSSKYKHSRPPVPSSSYHQGWLSKSGHTSDVNNPTEVIFAPSKKRIIYSQENHEVVIPHWTSLRVKALDLFEPIRVHLQAHQSDPIKLNQSSSVTQTSAQVPHQDQTFQKNTFQNDHKEWSQAHV